MEEDSCHGRRSYGDQILRREYDHRDDCKRGHEDGGGGYVVSGRDIASAAGAKVFPTVEGGEAAGDESAVDAYVGEKCKKNCHE